MRTSRLLIFIMLSYLLASNSAKNTAREVEDDLGSESDEGLHDTEGTTTQTDLAFEQYTERLQQQLESLRKEHDEIFGRGDTNKDGIMDKDEYIALHREAENGEKSDHYNQTELDEGYASLDRDQNDLLSLEEWRRPFEEHTDSWLHITDSEAQHEAHIARYKEVFNQIDKIRDGELDERELQIEVENLHARRRAVEEDEDEDGKRSGAKDRVVQISGSDMLLMMDVDKNGKVSFEEYLMGSALIEQ
eukprot:768344-Hanusia_phi.AAC.17